MHNPEQILQIIVIAIIPLILAITLHEAAHAYVASKLGDTTALMLGRVSLNPTRHIDPIGTLLVPACLIALGGFLFGWAKPVPVNRFNLNNPRRDMMLVAVAGPLANLIMALLWALLAKCAYTLALPSQSWLQSTQLFLQQTSLFGIKINIILMVLNLLPIPPLDGSKIVSGLLPTGAALAYERIEPYGIWILLLLIALNLLPSLIGPIVAWFLNIISLLLTL